MCFWEGGVYAREYRFPQRPEESHQSHSSLFRVTGDCEPPDTSATSSFQSFIFFPETGSLMGLDLNNCVRLAAEKAPAILLPSLPSTGITGILHHAHSLCGIKISGLHAGVTSAGPMEQYPQHNSSSEWKGKLGKELLNPSSFCAAFWRCIVWISFVFS